MMSKMENAGAKYLAEMACYYLKLKLVERLIYDIVGIIYFVNKTFFKKRIQNNPAFSKYICNFKKLDDDGCDFEIRFQRFYDYLVEEFYYIYTFDLRDNSNYIEEMYLISEFAETKLNLKNYMKMHVNEMVLLIRSKSIEIAHYQFEYFVSNIIFEIFFNYENLQFQAYGLMDLVGKVPFPTDSEFIKHAFKTVKYSQVDRTAIILYFYKQNVHQNIYYQTIDDFDRSIYNLLSHNQQYQYLHLIL